VPPRGETTPAALIVWGLMRLAAVDVWTSQLVWHEDVHTHQ
jgi:hypothetical protein